jgi:hypothetical protein
MKLRVNYNYIYIAILASFFFLWGVDFKEPFILVHENKEQIPDLRTGYLSSLKLSYLIIFLIIPIVYYCIKNYFLSFKQIFNYQQYVTFFKQIFNYQQYIIFLILFIVAHFFLVKIYYHEFIDKSEIANLFYLLLLSVIYCHYRNFIQVNFKKILTFYLIIFVTFSIFEGSQINNAGQCNGDLYIINLIQKYLKIKLTNSIYLENSHLAMMTIAVFFTSIYILVQEKKNNILFLLLFSIGVIIALNNLSTTFFVGYFFSQAALLLFFFKKMNIKFWIITILFLLINSYLFFSDKKCVIKITDFDAKSLVTSNLNKGTKNLTTLIYQRSIIVAKDTLMNYTLGWGMDGMDNATQNLQAGYVDCSPNDSIDYRECKKYSPDRQIFWPLYYLNHKDGLSNFFKMFTEFGVFAFFIFFMFIKYMVNIKNINSYNLFIIVLFITMCVRGAGYFNGGFIFCLLEFFYYKKFTHNLKFKNKIFYSKY